MASIFDVIRRYVVAGELEQAADQMGAVIKGMSERLKPKVRDDGLLLVKQAELVKSRAAARKEYRNRLLVYLPRLELAWGELPQPLIVAPAGQPMTPSALPITVDRRQVALIENPIRQLAWLEQGLITARAVCKVIGRGKVGTGFLLANGRIITNNHVLPTPIDAKEASVLFNFQDNFRGQPMKHVTYTLRQDDFATSVPLDCTIVGVAARRDQLRRWGAIEIEPAEDFAESMSVSIIQHPEGGPKRIALTGSVVTNADKPPYVYYETSTMKGSSGAPVLNDDWKVVAVHRAAGEWWEPRKRYVNNEGVRISAIANEPTLARRLQ
jgi:V8-like Glu-specific endopeptidase